MTTPPPVPPTARVPRSSSRFLAAFVIASIVSVLLSLLPLLAFSVEGVYLPLIIGAMAIALLLQAKRPWEALAVFFGAWVGPLVLFFVVLPRIAVGT